MPRRKDVNQIRRCICKILIDAYPEALHYSDIWEALIGEGFQKLKPCQVQDYLRRDTREYQINDFVERTYPGVYRFRLD